MNEPWPIEPVPDNALLFMRIHKNHIQDGRPVPGVFQNHGEGDDAGMSTDWNKYSTPQETLDRKIATSPTWQGGIIELVAGEVRKIPQQSVVHAPLSENRAHTNVKGPKKGKDATEVRYLFMRNWRWAIEFKG